MFFCIQWCVKIEYRINQSEGAFDNVFSKHKLHNIQCFRESAFLAFLTQ